MPQFYLFISSIIISGIYQFNGYLFDRIYHTNEGKVGIEIFPVEKRDGGWYTVSAQNEAGSVICTARLDIAGEFPSTT